MLCGGAYSQHTVVIVYYRKIWLFKTLRIRDVALLAGEMDIGSR